MILYHYPMSPFSEKSRLMLGFAGQSWQSLPCPEMPPRPGLDALAGGYRRIPVAQSGADMFCDSRLISDEIASLSGRACLHANGLDEDMAAYAKYLEGEVFWASVLSIPPTTIIRRLWSTIGLRKTLRFLSDRAGIGKTARVGVPSGKVAAEGFTRYLDDLASRLQADFLGGSSPAYIDFCAYHPLWFKWSVARHMPGPVPPAVEAWYQRMAAFGHGQSSEITVVDAFAAARLCEPRPVPEGEQMDPRMGSTVAVAPDDYALDAVRGTLAGLSATRIVVARETEESGTVHVHFPRSGYEISG